MAMHVNSLVMRASSPFEDRPLQHACGASSSTNRKLIHTASEISELPAGSDVKDVEHHSGLLPRVARVLAAVGDEVLLIGAEVDQADLEGTPQLIACQLTRRPTNRSCQRAWQR